MYVLYIALSPKTGITSFLINLLMIVWGGYLLLEFAVE